MGTSALIILILINIRLVTFGLLLNCVISSKQHTKMEMFKRRNQAVTLSTDQKSLTGHQSLSLSLSASQGFFSDLI